MGFDDPKKPRIFTKSTKNKQNVTQKAPIFFFAPLRGAIILMSVHAIGYHNLNSPKFNFFGLIELAVITIILILMNLC